MGLLKKIADYVSKANETITDFAQDLGNTGTGYKLEFASVYGTAKNMKQRIDAVGDMSVGEFIKEGLYELDDIKESAIKSTKESYMNVKKITSRFFNKRKEKFDNWKEKKNTQQKTQKKETSIDDIIKKDEVEKIKGTYKTNEEVKQNEQATPKYADVQNSKINVPKTTYNLTNSYKTNIANIQKTYGENISGLAQTLSGKQKENNKKIWKWTDRINSFENQLNKPIYSNKDIRGLEDIKQTLTTNKYLQKNHVEIANEIITKLDELIKKI